MTIQTAEFESVLVGAKEGAEWAWSKLYHWLAADLRGYMRARGADDPDGALGDVFVQLAGNIATFEGDSKGFRSWAFVVAHHRVIDQSRRRQRNRSVPTDPAALPPVAHPSSVEADVLASLSTTEIRAWLENHLTPDQLDVVLLRVFGGFSAAEVAQLLGKKPGAIRVSHHRALAALRKAFASGGVTK